MYTHFFFQELNTQIQSQNCLFVGLYVSHPTNAFTHIHTDRLVSLLAQHEAPIQSVDNCIRQANSEDDTSPASVQFLLYVGRHFNRVLTRRKLVARIKEKHSHPHRPTHAWPLCRIVVIGSSAREAICTACRRTGKAHRSRFDWSGTDPRHQSRVTETSDAQSQAEKQKNEKKTAESEDKLEYFFQQENKSEWVCALPGCVLEIDHQRVTAIETEIRTTELFLALAENVKQNDTKWDLMAVGGWFSVGMQGWLRN